jgi:hypothetical protein
MESERKVLMKILPTRAKLSRGTLEFFIRRYRAEKLGSYN